MVDLLKSYEQLEGYSREDLSNIVLDLVQHVKNLTEKKMGLEEELEEVKQVVKKYKEEQIIEEKKKQETLAKSREFGQQANKLKADERAMLIGPKIQRKRSEGKSFQIIADELSMAKSSIHTVYARYRKLMG